MPLPIAQPYPTAYEIANRILNPPTEPCRRERRAVLRHPFRFVQRIAAYHGEGSLAELRFYPVQCRDISRRGIAFVLPGPLDFSRLVVELGSESERMYFEAETVNFRFVAGSGVRMSGDVLAYKGSLGWTPRAVLIGCRFMRKLELGPV